MGAKKKDFGIESFDLEEKEREDIRTTSFRIKHCNNIFLKDESYRLGYSTVSAYLNALFDHLRHYSER